MLLQVANNSECICLHWQREGAGGDHVRGHWGTSSDCQREANQTTNWFGVKSMQRQEGAGRGGAVRVFCQLTWLVNLSVSLSVVGFAFYFPFAHYLRQRDSGTEPGGGRDWDRPKKLIEFALQIACTLCKMFVLHICIYLSLCIYGQSLYWVLCRVLGYRAKSNEMLERHLRPPSRIDVQFSVLSVNSATICCSNNSLDWLEATCGVSPPYTRLD